MVFRAFCGCFTFIAFNFLFLNQGATAETQTLRLLAEESNDDTLRILWRKSDVRPTPGPPKSNCHKYVVPCPKKDETGKKPDPTNLSGTWLIHNKLHGDLKSKLEEPLGSKGAVIWIEGPQQGELEMPDVATKEREWGLVVAKPKIVQHGDDMKRFWSIDLGESIPKAEVVPVPPSGRKGCWVSIPCEETPKP